MMNQTELVGRKVAGITTTAFVGFTRAMATILVGGLFLFYSYVTSVGAVQSVQEGLLLDGVVLSMMFVLAFGSFLYFVAVINGYNSE